MRRAAWLLLPALALAFLLLGSGLDFSYVIPKRLVRLGAIIVAGVCIALSSVIFQTLAGNRVLTPAIMGYEGIYLLFQALLVLWLGTASAALLGAQGNALLSIALMLGYSWLLQRWLLREGHGDVYRLLLLGLVLTMVLGTFTQFIQLKTSPGEFSILQSLGYTSFNRAQPTQVLYSGLLVAAVALLVARGTRVLDVLALGRDQAIALGLDHGRCLRLQMALIAVLVAVSTSLVGPTAFMGVFVANIAYALARSARHQVTLPLACAVAIGMFLLAQLLVEHLFNYRTSVSILVNLVCGAYFLALMVRTRGTP
ncbi:iron chelate uptake ABC transporter family permease subunit [Pseudomonas mosselii]|uniref:Iron chelate uptake ABC transporter family permease subunit n=1 Tax=Pseudomonas mosselii TaxID=78327 RepID=A0ABX9B8D4_9PSED|nr:iron chelate uptake ABC transporter family permease subunit [Pseudomonas mosselii]MCL8302044.1 iron chelate uptake ABC transporter family permease subunit [Pseudomonas mosselii]MCL8340777.1 iron chelate uptake ABC transporter family permease subunit [Pseudomonas mosselii]MCU9528906.1 iron chelate uptake ABC transporter family permease subunit [Pseudomonas mosselii]MCU9536860.1 iron chelate uptake ABC transporter family permease subunit [Pseudomonas mosselii]MCU9542540.1 iron chelate uptake 